MEKTGNVEDEYNGAAMIQKCLWRIRVLLVLDDVDQLTQLEKLAGHPNWFGPGSRIIITSTDIHLLNTHGVDAVYQATVLDPNEALQLMSLKAFKKIPPPENYLELCHSILTYAHGLPLALVVMGCFLYGKSTNEWRSAIDMLKKTPEKSITDVLHISFDGLREIEKEVFLHIACFYKGKDRNRVTEILDYCQLHPDINLRVLVDKSLITISNNEICMHDLLQEMGREIVRQESPKEPGKRSRLWSHEDIHNVLKKNEGTDAIQGIVMDLPELEMAHWHPEAFSNLSKLTLLHIHNVNLSKGLTCLSSSLRLVEWIGYPLRSLPQNFKPDELIELNLCHSNIDQLWKGKQCLDKLKLLKLCHSHNIVKTPDFTGVQNLETLDLEGCINLTRVHQSLRFLKRLVVLNLKDCKSLEGLPGKIESQSLETFILSGCSKVKKIPEFVENMKHLSTLCLDKTAIKELPSSIEHLSGLASLDLSNCKDLVSLPSTIHSLKSLKKLNLSGCLKLGQSHASVTEWKDLLRHGCEVVWEYFSWSLSSVWMQSDDTEPTSMPLSVSDLCSSTEQRMNRSLSMRLPLFGLCNLTDLNLSNCNLGDTAFANNFGYFPSLLALNLSGNNFSKLPPGIRSCLKLEKINLENCMSLQDLSGLPSNSTLDIRADGCSSLEMLLHAFNFDRLNISYLNFINCFKIKDYQGCNSMSIEMLKLFLCQGISNAKQTFQVVLPGGIIPSWFSHGRPGVSLSHRQRPDFDFWDTKSLMGFALCVVFRLHEHHHINELNTDQFKTFKATHHLVCCLKVNGRELEVCGRQPAFRFSEEFCRVESHHIWLFYVPCDYFGTEWKTSNQIEFLFETKGPGLKVERCGVRPIYEQDVQEMIKTMNHSNSRIEALSP
ncbi:disease resistance protein RPP2B-like [Rosa chinensis]|uniref:disease resistance protein RPP2B-like n=1 Tax=Rosa chinensis TaxID=74649 RepID=UPI000D091579|nr:disease resistance protein RPP2B-like [Rosa chinensis]XP_024182659.1 disease resistance protein RPP2B-like [Rosa chinensis]XP_024182660.1 disease resistance protein RPP2B-like [Rosa chinensis]